MKALEDIKKRCEAATPEIDTFIQAVSDGAHGAWPDYWRGFADNAQREAISMRTIVRTDIPRLVKALTYMLGYLDAYGGENNKLLHHEEVAKILNGEGE